jgi:rSAM/selenodomain-associated transferase 2
MNQRQLVSIIIPTYNEADQIEVTIRKTLAANNGHPVEIIVVDGGSTDDTLEIASKSGAITVKSKRKGRAAQMNAGALMAKGDVLYFLHADSVPPQGFTSHILEAMNGGAASGCFRLAFDHDHWFLRANSWFTRFNVNAVRFGDQSLFVAREVFQRSGGFRENLLMMEDQEIIHRLRIHGRFRVMDDVVITSARKYIDNGVYRMQGIFYTIWLLYYLGFSQQRLLKIHRKLIRKNKL